MLNRIYFILVLLITLSGYTQSVKAQEYMGRAGYVEFISTAPLLEFKGTSNELNGLIDLDQNLVDFYVDLNTLETGIRRRDRDMRNSYLQTDQFPFAEFTGELISNFDPDLSGTQNVLVKGLFKIHGVEREIEVEGTLISDEDRLELEAGWVILLEDYNIERPRVLFYELAEEQTINISIHLTNESN